MSQKNPPIVDRVGLLRSLIAEGNGASMSSVLMALVCADPLFDRFQAEYFQRLEIERAKEYNHERNTDRTDGAHD
jgi:hypothetical protein